jgi:acyl-CoA synthetase (AMP-forming)/AMP-acid ligase II
MPAPDAASMFRHNAADPQRRDRPALRFGDRVWTHREYVAECVRFGNLFLARRRPGRPFHVAVLLDNTPDYLFALGGAGMVGAALVGLNHTRRGEHLRRDMSHTDVGLVITEPRHEDLLRPALDGLDLPGGVLVSSRFAGPDGARERLGEDLDEALSEVEPGDRGLEPGADCLWALIFTSGTSDAPKAVRCSQRRILVTGVRMSMTMHIGPSDVGYLCMPLFHSNAVMVGWAPSVVKAASVGLARRFSASRWLPDIRHYGATYFNYTGKPLSYVLSTPERPDDADNSLRVAFGNEGSGQVVADFSRRFGVEVIDAFGATEGGVAVNRAEDAPPGSLGRAGEGVNVVDEEGSTLPPARFGSDGRLLNAEECVGEIVNTKGLGPFEGYYNNDEANSRATRNGWYWSGDLGYVDDKGFLFFAGRTAEWIRVDGENFPAGPVEAALSRHPDVLLAAVYGVPDEQAGDQVMAALVMRPGVVFDPDEFSRWLGSQGDLGPKWHPRYLRVADTLPLTPTNKVLKRTLVHQKFCRDRIGEDALFVRQRGETTYRPFTSEDEEGLHEAFETADRARFWDL